MPQSTRGVRSDTDLDSSARSSDTDWHGDTGYQAGNGISSRCSLTRNVVARAAFSSRAECLGA